MEKKCCTYIPDLGEIAQIARELTYLLTARIASEKREDELLHYLTSAEFI